MEKLKAMRYRQAKSDVSDAMESVVRLMMTPGITSGETESLAQSMYHLGRAGSGITGAGKAAPRGES